MTTSIRRRISPSVGRPETSWSIWRLKTSSRSTTARFSRSTRARGIPAIASGTWSGLFSLRARSSKLRYSSAYRQGEPTAASTPESRIASRLLEAKQPALVGAVRSVRRVVQPGTLDDPGLEFFVAYSIAHRNRRRALQPVGAITLGLTLRDFLP